MIREGENMVRSRAMCARDCCLKGRRSVRRGQVEARAQALDLAGPQCGLGQVTSGQACFAPV